MRKFVKLVMMVLVVVLLGGCNRKDIFYNKALDENAATPTIEAESAINYKKASKEFEKSVLLSMTDIMDGLSDNNLEPNEEYHVDSYLNEINDYYVVLIKAIFNNGQLDFCYRDYVGSDLTDDKFDFASMYIWNSPSDDLLSISPNIFSDTISNSGNVFEFMEVEAEMEEDLPKDITVTRDNDMYKVTYIHDGLIFELENDNHYKMCVIKSE